MERFIYSEISWFCYSHTIDCRWSKSTFGNSDSGMTQTSPIAPVSLPPQLTSPLIVSAVCWLVDSSQRDPSLRNRLIFTRSIFPGIFHKTRCPSVQTSITAVSPWSRGKRSSLERTGGALVRREIPLYTRSRGARITSPFHLQSYSQRRGVTEGVNRNLRSLETGRVSSR